MQAQKKQGISQRRCVAPPSKDETKASQTILILVLLSIAVTLSGCGAEGIEWLKCGPPCDLLSVYGCSNPCSCSQVSGNDDFSVLGMKLIDGKDVDEAETEAIIDGYQEAETAIDDELGGWGKELGAKLLYGIDKHALKRESCGLMLQLVPGTHQKLSEQLAEQIKYLTVAWGLAVLFVFCAGLGAGKDEGGPIRALFCFCPLVLGPIIIAVWCAIQAVMWPRYIAWKIEQEVKDMFGL